MSSSRQNWGKLPPYRHAVLPRFPGWAAALGPGVVWMALAQGSSELIWWPYLIAKYGLAFLFLLIPACLLQFPINYAIGSYTLLTGETIFQGFIRLNRWVALVLWVLMTASFLWFGSFASAGGTAMAALTHFPSGWDARGQTLFWSYASITVFFAALVFSRVIYRVVERFMETVALVTLVGLAVACSHETVRSQIPVFVRSLFMPSWSLPRPWDSADATKLLTAITFAGLGGFWTLFYSCWLREKGAGMAKAFGHVEGLAGRHAVVFESGLVPQAVSPEIRTWRRFLAVDSAVGIVGNIVTTLMTCLLAFAVLYPQGLMPDKYEIAVVQSRFFELSWGVVGKMLFLIVAAAFLSDTWMATADGVARIHTDCILSFFPQTRGWPIRRVYLSCLILLTVVTAVTMLLAEPGKLILLSAVIGFAGTVSFPILLYFLNHRLLPRHLDRSIAPQRWAVVGLGVAGLAYAALAAAYVQATLVK